MYEPIIGALLGLRASAVGLGEGDGSSSTLVAVGVVLGVLGLLLLAYVTFVFCRARSESRAFDEMEEALIDDKGAASPRNGRRNDGGGGRGGSGGSARASDANDQRRPLGGGQSGGSGQWGMGTDMSASQSSSQGAGTEKSDLGLPVRYQLEAGPEPEFDEQTGAPMNAAARKKFGKDWQRKGRTSTRAGKTGQSGGGRQSFGRQLPYSELELATDGFNAKRLLGKGGSCLVYRGRVCEQPVAVKRLQQTKGSRGEAEGGDNPEAQGGVSQWDQQQFASEMQLLCKVVQLVQVVQVVQVVKVVQVARVCWCSCCARCR